MTGTTGRALRAKTSPWPALFLVAALASCSEQGPSGPPDMPAAPAGLVVSDPVAAASGALPESAAGMIYVSADPGTFPDGVSATVANSATGASVTAEVVDGGFDPVAVAGSPGDELEITVLYSDGTSESYGATAAERKRPRVVRTRPQKDAVDVPLNSIIVVVFSEPIASGTITPQTIALQLDGAPIAATLTLDDAGLLAVLEPDHLLEPETAYTLAVGADIRDLEGDALEEAVTVSFQTAVAVRNQTLRNQIVFYSHNIEDWRNGVYDSEILVMNVDGSGVVNLTSHPAGDYSPAVSPDGTRILFVTDRDGNDEIYVMNADGSGLVNLTNHPAADGSPAWSPDGTKIAFVSYRDSGGAVGCAGGTSPVLWPCPDIFVMDANGSNPVNLTNRPMYDDGYPAWSPDGTKIAFASNFAEPDSVPGSGNYHDIFVMDPDGANVVKLTDIEGPMRYGYWPTWSPDGTRIAFTGGPGPSGIWVMDADGSNPVLLTAGEGSVYGTAVWPSWSPDGARIAFRACDIADSCVQDEVFIMNADGTNPVNLTNRPGFYDAVGSPQAWSPQR